MKDDELEMGCVVIVVLLIVFACGMLVGGGIQPVSGDILDTVQTLTEHQTEQVKAIEEIAANQAEMMRAIMRQRGIEDIAKRLAALEEMTRTMETGRPTP